MKNCSFLIQIFIYDIYYSSMKKSVQFSYQFKIWNVIDVSCRCLFLFFFTVTTDEDIRLEYMILRQYERTKIRILIHFYRNWTQKLKNRISYPYQRWTQNFKNAQCTFCVLHKWVATLQKTRKDAKLNKV